MLALQRWLSFWRVSGMQFQKLCEVLQISHVASDERFATNPNRVAHRELLLATLADR